MGTQYCVLIQDRFDNEAKFTLAITHDQPLQPEAVLWIAKVYTAKRWGTQPDVYRTAELDIDVDWHNIVYVPSEHVLDFESSEYWPTQEQRKLARMALDAYALFHDEMARQQRIISSFVRQEMHKQYGIDTVAMRLPSVGGNYCALDILIHLEK
jgi:hypothetical protein